MSKGPMIQFGGKPRPAEPERVVERAPEAPQRAPQPPPQRLAEPRAQIRTVLGQGCVVEGKLVCTGPTQLDGRVTGELQADDLLIVDRNAAIVADLNVQELVVRGSVKGNITAARRVTLEETAQVEGDIAAPAIEMKIGAQMSGKIDVIHHARSTQAQSPASQPSLAPQPAHVTPKEAAQAQPQFVAFDDGADRSGF